MADSRLEGRVIAVAGAGGGLGPVVCGHLAASGATIGATDISQERLDAIPGDAGIPDDRWDGRVVDLLDEASAAGWCADLVERFGRVDGLVHLVGGWKGGQPLHTEPLEDWALLHDLLIRTVQHTTRGFHAALSGSEHGRFVLVSAKQAQHPSNDNAIYASAKAAAEAWTLAYADGFKEVPATANIIVVNAILTPQMREANPEKAYATFTPAEHLAEAIAFLCSDEGGRMNGQRLSLHP